MKVRIAVLGGDGIGPEVTDSAVLILKSVAAKFKHDFIFDMGIVGGKSIDMYGNPLPSATKNIINSSDAVLFGAVGGPKWDDPNLPLRPESAILDIRQELNLFANLRPVKVYPSIAHLSPIKKERLENVDFIIVRELTGGLYFHKPKRKWETRRGRKAVDTLYYTEKEITRILHIAFELARQRKRKLHSIDKMNVLATGRLWRELADEIRKNEYNDVEVIHMLVDNAAMQLITNPAQFDVIVTENTFGDILSDEAAIITGSMGMLASASISSAGIKSRRRKRFLPMLYEPIHGSAPDIVGKNVANPIGAILSAAMMLRISFGLEEEAKAIEQSVNVVIDEGILTADLAPKGTLPHSTYSVTQIIAENIHNKNQA